MLTEDILTLARRTHTSSFKTKLSTNLEEVAREREVVGAQVLQPDGEQRQLLLSRCRTRCICDTSSLLVRITDLHPDGEQRQLLLLVVVGDAAYATHLEYELKDLHPDVEQREVRALEEPRRRAVRGHRLEGGGGARFKKIYINAARNEKTDAGGGVSLHFTLRAVQEPSPSNAERYVSAGGHPARTRFAPRRFTTCGRE